MPPTHDATTSAGRWAIWTARGVEQDRKLQKSAITVLSVAGAVLAALFVGVLVLG